MNSAFLFLQNLYRFNMQLVQLIKHLWSGQLRITEDGRLLARDMIAMGDSDV